MIFMYIMVHTLQQMRWEVSLNEEKFRIGLKLVVCVKVWNAEMRKKFGIQAINIIQFQYYSIQSISLIVLHPFISFFIHYSIASTSPLPLSFFYHSFHRPINLPIPFIHHIPFKTNATPSFPPSHTFVSIPISSCPPSFSSSFLILQSLIPPPNQLPHASTN